MIKEFGSALDVRVTLLCEELTHEESWINVKVTRKWEGEMLWVHLWGVCPTLIKYKEIE